MNFSHCNGFPPFIFNPNMPSANLKTLYLNTLQSMALASMKREESVTFRGANDREHSREDNDAERKPVSAPSMNGYRLENCSATINGHPNTNDVSNHGRFSIENLLRSSSDRKKESTIKPESPAVSPTTHHLSDLSGFHGPFMQPVL